MSGKFPAGRIAELRERLASNWQTNWSGTCGAALDEIDSLNRDISSLRASLESKDRRIAELEAENRAASALRRSASKLCEWIRHTVPEWTPEVDKYLEQTEARLKEGRE